jgi:hypothetical protein
VEIVCKNKQQLVGLVTPMFQKNDSHAQEQLFSPVKELPPSVQKKLENHWSTHFYELVFSQIDEEKFEVMYHNGYSRPNKPVNELVSLEIIKHLMDLSDEELEYAYLFDFRVRNALGKETLGDNICQKTFTNFRRRLMEYEEETGRDLLHEVFEDHRDYLIDEFDIDGSTQRMDSTFIEANIKQLSRVDLIAKVLHNFLTDLPAEIGEELPAGMDRFADVDNLSLSYQLEPDEISSTIDTLIEHTAWLVDRFEDKPEYASLESFAHLERVLDEQCYRITELESENNTEDDDDDDGQSTPGDESPGWKPLREFTSIEEEKQQEAATDDKESESDWSDDRVGLKEPDKVGSGSLQHPHDDEATYREKNDEDYFGYKANVAETCDGENPFRVITAVRVATNNTPDGELLEEDVPELPKETGLKDLLVDAGFADHDVEALCKEYGITQHFSGIRGQKPPEEKISLADAEWERNRMVACPAGHEPFDQTYLPESGRYSGKMDKSLCSNCPHEENCFVREKVNYYGYGFYERRLTVAQRRKRVSDPEEEFLQLRAGAESLVNEVYHQDREKTKFTGEIKVKNASTAKAIGTNLKRVSRFLESGAQTEKSAG